MIKNFNYLGDEVLRVKKAIEMWIKEKGLQPGERLPSQNKLVKMLRCSHSTVHKAMQSLVAEGIIVRKVGHGTFLSFSPEYSTQRFSNGRENYLFSDKGTNLAKTNLEMKTIMFCSIYSTIPPLNSPAHEILATAENKLYQSSHKYSLKPMFTQIRTFDEFKEKIQNIKPDGVIIDWEQIEEISFSPLLVELLTEKMKIPTIHCFHYCKKEYSLKRIVEINNSEISVMAMSYLHSLGHKNIMLIATEKSHGFDDIRINTAIDYAESSDINLITFKYKNGNPNDWIGAGKSAYTTFKKIEETQKPTAIFAINDKTALAFVEEALKDGVKIPEDISIIGVDNEISSYLSTGINLTSIDPSRKMVGEKAAQWMIEILNNKNDTENYSITIKCHPKLVIRQSTCEYKKRRIENEI